MEWTVFLKLGQSLSRNVDVPISIHSLEELVSLPFSCLLGQFTVRCAALAIFLVFNAFIVKMSINKILLNQFGLFIHLWQCSD